jgi:NAD+ synthase (glutamine-hydrolysing)
MKLALLQCNYTVGDLGGNAELLRDGARRAMAQGAELAIASELALTGYPPRDLLERPGFIAATAAATNQLVATAPEIPLLFGTVAANDGRLENQALLAFGGRVLARAVKQLLPNYDVFDEQRHFRPGRELCFAVVAGRRVAVSICEDAWAQAKGTKGRYAHDPLSALNDQRAALLVNLSASPFTLVKRYSRERLFADVARRFDVPVAMTNQVGANDELVFDGSSAVFGRDGTVLARARAFQDDLLLFDDQSPGRVEPLAERDEEAGYQALVLGVRDYARKCGFGRAVLGLSGGIDSALVATVAADALGPEQVLGVAMPSRYSSPGSIEDARALAANLGIGFRVISIDEMFQTTIEQLSGPLDELRPPGERDVTWENVQARIRGATIMAISNRTGALPLTTGNKSELAVGYCTLYGDMVGGLAVISDVPKTMVYRIARWVNEAAKRIPPNSIEKAPSAELRPDQTDQDSLPPYEVLDAILERYVERHQSPDTIVRAGFDQTTVERVVRMIVMAEYKRRQAAPGIIITDKAFGSGRRLPIARVFALSSD